MFDENVDQLADSIGGLVLSEASSANTIRLLPDKPPKPKTKQKLKPWHKVHLQTAIVYDDFMAKHDCPWIKPDECPQRYNCVVDKCLEYGLIGKCVRLPTKIATKDDVLLVHSEQHFETISALRNETNIEKLKKACSKYDGVFMNEFSFDAAMMALGCAIQLTNAVIDSEQVRNGFAIIRTPGHHAMKDEANGYCIFNNAAIVAKHACVRKGVKRVLIVDWDIHHGQGTQSIFYDDPNVMYISIHRFERGKFWPELIESNFNFTGLAKAKGFNINVPLNETGCNDADYLLIWFNLIMPIAYEFDPELVIISAGYDAAFGCPEGKMRVKPTFYSVLCHSLMSLANGKVVCLLEGGYNLLSLAEGAAATLRTLLSLPCPKLDERFIEIIQPHQSVVQSILSSIWALRPQWNCLHLQGSFERFNPESGISAGGDVDLRLKFAPVAIYEGSNANDTRPEEYDVNQVVCDKDLELQEKLNQEIKYITSLTDLTLPKNGTLLMFDDRMIKHKCIEPHPEKPARYSQILARLEKSKLIERCTIGMTRLATKDEVAAVHDIKYINRLEKTKHESERRLEEISTEFDSIYINKHSYECALLAVGCVIEAVDKVMSGKSSNAFAVIRPPGHHAGFDYPAGFCFFNNVVVGAKYALNKYKDTCKKVLIVDYDFHHGDGVQSLVENDDNFLYISLHGYNDATEYPFKQESNYTTRYKNIINIPWNDDIMGDTEYLLAYFTIVLPIAYEFNPDLVLVSSGFDAAINDPLGKYEVSPAAFGHLIHHLLPLASGKLVACLEGGYNLESISESTAHVVSVLLGDPPASLGSLLPPNDAAIITMKNVISYNKSNYKLLCLDYDLPSDQIDD